MNDPRYATLLGWIRAKPSLAGIRINGDDRKVVRIAGRQFSTAERAVLALDPETLEGLDADGTILRTFTVKDAVAQAPVAPRTVDTWPQGDVAELGQVIALACDRAVSRVENIYKDALDKMARLYDKQSDRMSQLEDLRFRELEARMAELETEREEAIADAEEAKAALAETSPGTGDALVGHVLGAAAQKMLSGEAGPNGKG